MIKGIQLSFKLFASVSVVILAFFIIATIFTKKYNHKYEKFYSVFLNMTKREAILLATILLNLLLIVFFLIDAELFNPYGIYAIIAINIISCIFALNIQMIIVNIIYTMITLGLLWLLELVRNYLKFIAYDKDIVILEILFIILIVFFALFITIRKFEIFLKSQNKARGKI